MVKGTIKSKLKTKKSDNPFESQATTKQKHVVLNQLEIYESIYMKI